MAQKKHKFDQSAILAGEPTGGWGRTIGGADTLTQKMLKNPDTAIEASESKTHLDLVRLCRTMQPTKIEGTLQDDLDQGLSALEWTGVTFFTIAALLRRRTKQLRLATESAPTDENVSAFTGCTNPWRSREVAPHRAKTPTVRSLMANSKDRVLFFLDHVCGKPSYHRFSGELMDKPA